MDKAAQGTRGQGINRALEVCRRGVCIRLHRLLLALEHRRSAFGDGLFDDDEDFYSDDEDEEVEGSNLRRLMEDMGSM